MQKTIIWTVLQDGKNYVQTDNRASLYTLEVNSGK